MSILAQTPIVGQDALQFIFAHPAYHGQFAEINTGTHPVQSGYFPVEGFIDQLDGVLEAYASTNIWLGALPRAVTRPYPACGRNDDVTTFATAFVDLDDKDLDPADPAEGHREWETVLAKVARAQKTAPVLVVETGGGYHLWWSLTEPVDKETWDELERNLYLAMFRDFDKGMAAYKSAHDPRRILRLPGSTNFKEKYGPAGRPVRVIHENLIRVDPQVLLKAAKQTADKLRPNRRVENSKTADVLAILRDGAKPGSRHAAVASLTGKLLAHGLGEDSTSEIVRCWWQTKVVSQGYADANDTEMMERELDDLCGRYAPPPLVAIDITEAEREQLERDYPLLSTSGPTVGIRQALADGVAAGRVLTFLNRQGMTGEALIGRVLATRGINR